MGGLASGKRAQSKKPLVDCAPDDRSQSVRGYFKGFRIWFNKRAGQRRPEGTTLKKNPRKRGTGEGITPISPKNVPHGKKDSRNLTYWGVALNKKKEENKRRGGTFAESWVSFLGGRSAGRILIDRPDTKARAPLVGEWY